MATGYRHDREAIINRARCSIVLFLEEQSEITKEGGRWRGGGRYLVSLYGNYDCEE